MVWFLGKEDWMLGGQSMKVSEYELVISKKNKKSTIW